MYIIKILLRGAMLSLFLKRFGGMLNTELQITRRRRPKMSEKDQGERKMIDFRDLNHVLGSNNSIKVDD